MDICTDSDEVIRTLVWGKRVRLLEGKTSRVGGGQRRNGSLA